MDIQEHDAPATPAEETPPHPLERFLKADAPQLPRVGDIVEGPVIARGTATIFVDLGAQGTGIVYGREFFLARDILKEKRIGDTLSAKVIDPENIDGYIELSAVAAGRELAWGALERIFAEKETVNAEIESANRGGLVANVEGVKAFLPVSQLSPEHYPHVDGGDKEKILEALRDFVGKKLATKILTLDPSYEKLILSERAVLEEELREELKNFHAGDIVDGKIAGIVDFGLFVRFGQDERLEGLVHVSEITPDETKSIRDRFATGEKVKAKIVDMQGDRVSLSLKTVEIAKEPKKESPLQETAETAVQPAAEETTSEEHAA